MRRLVTLVAVLSMAGVVAGADRHELVPTTLPVLATTGLDRSLEAASRHASHAWRDTPPLNADGTVNGYVEIPRGDRHKWEFDIPTGRALLDERLRVRRYDVRVHGDEIIVSLDR